MKYSSKDCKNFLIGIYKDTKEKDWKSIKKYNNQNNYCLRDLKHTSGLCVTLMETFRGLKIINSNDAIKNTSDINNDKEKFDKFMAQVLGENKENIFIDDEDNLYNNPKSTFFLQDISFNDMKTNDEKFIYIMINKYQLEPAKGERTSTYFYELMHEQERHKFVNVLKSSEIDLPNLFLLHIINICLMIDKEHETDMPYYIMGSEDSLLNMNLILKDICEKWEFNSFNTVNLDPNLANTCCALLKKIKKSYDLSESQEKWNDAEIDKELEKLNNLIKSKI